MLTGDGQLGAIAVAAATTKVEVQLCEPQASVTVYVNDRLAPSQKALAGSVGTEAILVVALHPPVKLNPATQAV